MNNIELETARNLHTQRGYFIEITCNRAVKAGRLSLSGVAEEQAVSVNLLYLGAKRGEGEEKKNRPVHPENDPWTYCALYSGFPEDISPYTTWGFLLDRDSNLWCEYYNNVYLKAPDLFDRGLEIEFEVPEIVAAKKPELLIICNGEILYQEVLDTPGKYTLCRNLQGIDRELVRYMIDVRSQQKAILAELNRVFEKYGLNYYLIGGSLLGYVRSGGPVPWDDDLDIAMTREDYEKFCSIADSEWDGTDFLLLKPEDFGEGLFYDFMTRLVYMKETIAGDPFERNGESGRADIHFHLPVDIYILDKTNPSEFIQNLKVKRLMLLYALALGHRPSFQNQKIMYKRNYWAVGNRLRKIGKHISLKTIFRRYFKLIREKKSKKNSRGYYQSNGYFGCLGKVFPTDIFGNGKTVIIGDSSVKIPEDPEAFLKTMYGDYRRFVMVWHRKTNFLKTVWYDPDRS